MARKKQEGRFRTWVELEESYCIEFGNHRIFIEVPEPENTESRKGAKGLTQRVHSLLKQDKVCT